MRPFFDASEFLRPACVKDEHRYQGLRYNCTLNSQCSSATWTAGHGGASETLGNQDGDEGHNGKSDVGVVKKSEDRKRTRETRGVEVRDEVCACA
jgi:hypothetical protein